MGNFGSARVRLMLLAAFLAVPLIFTVDGYLGWSSGEPSHVVTGEGFNEGEFLLPRGRWRLATFAELDQTTIWLSHIVVQHSESDFAVARELDWRPDPPAPARSVTAAARIAKSLSKKAKAEPGQFASLADRYSDDVVTRGSGGRLGGVRASQLRPEYLDAIATTPIGVPSKAFATPVGFVVILQHGVPDPAEVSGSRLVIGYEGTVGGTERLGRSRGEARRIALDLHDQLRRRPEAFDELVSSRSDGPEAHSRGDLGEFSTTDPGYLPREVLLLSELSVGEISGPLDSKYGFAILRRDLIRSRNRYAAKAIELEPLGDTETDKNTALDLATSIRRQVGDAPDEFELYRARYCCDKAYFWSDGPSRPLWAPAIEKMKVDEIHGKPFWFEGKALILKRVDPRAPAVRRLLKRRYELPSPSAPNFEALIAYNDGETLALLSEALERAVSLEPAFRQHMESIGSVMKQLRFALLAAPADTAKCRELISEAQKALRSHLGDITYADFVRFSTNWAVKQMMGG